ncbi:MAG: sporulation protein YunB, partial [Bacillaceae bacterium]
YKFKPPVIPFTFRRRYIVFLLIIVTPIFLVWFINRSIQPSVMSYAQTHTKKIAVVAISDAIEQVTKENLDKKNLITSTVDNQGKIASVDFDATIINQFLARLTKAIEENMQVSSLKQIATEEIGEEVAVDSKKREMVLEVPLGMVTGNTILGSLGPNIPISFQVIGDVVTDVKKSIQPYGINNALVDVSVHVEADLKVVIPFETELSKIKMDIPVTMRVIQGEVPNWYNGSGNNSGIIPSIPIEGKKKN